MKIEQREWSKENGWQMKTNTSFSAPPQLVLVFGGRVELEYKERFEEIRNFYPESNVVLASTAGEILGTNVKDHSLSLTAVQFEKTKLEFAEMKISDQKESEQVGIELAKKISYEGLSHVMIFSEGLNINGTSFVRGLSSQIPDNIAITGGFVGDGPDFNKMLVGLNESPDSNLIVIIGFYGNSLKVGHGSFGGWDMFGPERILSLITTFFMN